MNEERTRNGGIQMPSLVEAVDRLADEMDDVHRHGSGPAVEYVRGDRVFAAREGTSLSFCLRPEVVAAALQTPDTAPSTRGLDWITLRPGVVDGFAIDRGLAWFESAWRLAGEPPAVRPPTPRPN
jgi:hypothetical protein